MLPSTFCNNLFFYIKFCIHTGMYLEGKLKSYTKIHQFLPSISFQQTKILNLIYTIMTFTPIISIFSLVQIYRYKTNTFHSHWNYAAWDVSLPLLGWKFTVNHKHTHYKIILYTQDLLTTVKWVKKKIDIYIYIYVQSIVMFDKGNWRDFFLHFSYKLFLVLVSTEQEF